MKKKMLWILSCVIVLVMGCAMTVSAETTSSSSLSRPKISTLTRKGKGNVYVYWSKISGASGYEIAYATDIDYTDATTATVSKGSTVKATISKSKVTTSKDTYFHMRAYKKLSDGSKEYSNWSASVRICVWNSDWKYAKNSKIHSDPAVLYYSTAASDKKKGKTVAVNAGHGTSGGSSKKTLCHPDGSAKVTGGSTGKGAKYATAVSGGTTIKGKSEAARNLTVAKKVKSKLLAEGYNVLMIRQTSDVQLDNVARTVMANHRADCHIAIHYDSTSSNKGAFYCGVPDVKSYRNMTPVKEHYKQHEAFGKDLIAGLKASKVKIFGSKGRMAIDLTQTSYSTIPSVDLEIGDKKTSVSSTQIDKTAKGIVKGINKYF